MMRPATGLFLMSLVLVAYAIPTPNDIPHKVKENIKPPRGWLKQKPAPPDHVIELRIALPQSDFETLVEHLYKVSDPFHERYGQHLSKEEVEALVAPHDESISLVDDWLLSHGLNKDNFVRSPAKDWVTVRVPVALAEKMLDTVSNQSF